MLSALPFYIPVETSAMRRSVVIPMLLASSLCAVTVEAAASEVTLSPRIKHGVGDGRLSQNEHDE